MFVRVIVCVSLSMCVCDLNRNFVCLGGCESETENISHSTRVDLIG